MHTLPRPDGLEQMAQALDRALGLASAPPKSYHRHDCSAGCGDYWICHNPDRCDPRWTCPTCEQEQLDTYWQNSPEPEHSPQLTLALMGKESDS